MKNKELLRQLTITGVHRATENAVNITLDPKDWKPVAKSGQFITFLFTTPHGNRRRSYSISSCPELNEPLRITVKKMDNGEFSRPLNYSLRNGDTLSCTGIHGLFTLPPESDKRHLVFLAAGSGVTPCFAMIRLALIQRQNKVTLIYSNSSKSETIFHDELTALVKAHPQRFQLKLLFSNSDGIYSRRLSKWLLEHFLKELVPDHTNALYFLCGPFSYMQMCRITLLNTVHPHNILQEDFLHHPPLILPEPPDREAHNVTIRIRGKNLVIPVKYPLSITKSAAKMGIQLPYSCEAGRCASCVATIVKGKLWMAYNQVLTDAEIKIGRVLTCQAFPVGGDVEITYDN